MSAFNVNTRSIFNNIWSKTECIRDVIKILGNDIDVAKRFTNYDLLDVSKDAAINVARFALDAFVAIKKKSRKRVNVNESIS